mmetsp:Transcript_11824/g.30382  ORF Transcript_11824/g.30382 Transcript_11824/m.30382 type:complete len:444 (+) Transcript_11824:226-1557(+)|eukprot:CAMPEP_0182936182 /NCGR_PEP_ID=MMETSP0105_2-20130417/39761_1 /TAXON_ID=81532 ORGANISM="Acanthoeca-like sp., Strain 10tr" /NCGR_SAMPLE_ID=MMETSP0105_2 /ASSEMBLY_ACC=CAM_ASM_000205 /LENGTH=443 /DNA_ID=CAMNT_0025075251 /DNA_START=119 /DNA_END=1450 /DNA_ORIENTATION=+
MAGNGRGPTCPARLARALTLVLAFAPLAAPSATASLCRDNAGSLSAVRGPCHTGTTAAHVAGANIFDQLWVGSSGMSTCCNATGGPATYADAWAALQSAHSAGVRVFRFFASLFGANQAFWLKEPATFWAEFDRLVDDIERLGMVAIPSLGTGMWHEVANAAHPGLNESANDGIVDFNSTAFKLNQEYFAQVVTRYAGRRGILAWELGNELNLMVNLPPPWCGAAPCFNTSAMVRYETALVDIIHAKDPGRPISSGHSAPRSSAWHQEHCGAKNADPTQCSGGYWGLDTQEQWLDMLAQQSDAVDIVSIHHYAAPSGIPPCEFSPAGKLVPGATCGWNASAISLFAEAVAKQGKMLYVGEYGGAGPDFTGPSPANQSFDRDVLDIQVADAKAGGVFALSTIWAWACPSHRADMVCIWPESARPKETGSDRMVADIVAANKAML